MSRYTQIFSFQLLIFLALSVLFIPLSAQLVSATVADTLNGLTDSMAPLFRFLVGDVSATGTSSSAELLFVKFLVFILILSVVSVSVKRIPQFGENTRISFVVSLIVSLIAVRYLTQGELINLIWLPYGVLGVVFSSLLPFIIGFFFFESFDSSLIRKVGWTTFAVIFFTLTALRWDDLALKVGTSGEWYSNLAVVYLIIGIISVILFIFDRDIHALVGQADIDRITDTNKRIHAAGVVTEIQHLQAQLATHLPVDSRRAIERRIKELKKNLRSLQRS